MKKSKGMADVVYKLKDEVMGVKEYLPDPIPIEDPETRELITDPERIKEHTPDYCLNKLKDREPYPE